jgi:ABC-2 type transport system ATP-binding protein
VVQAKRAGAQAHLLVRDGGPDGRSVPPGWESHPVGLEELVLAYLRPAGGRTSSAAVYGAPTELSEASK